MAFFSTDIQWLSLLDSQLGKIKPLISISVSSLLPIVNQNQVDDEDVYEEISPLWNQITINETEISYIYGSLENQRTDIIVNAFDIKTSKILLAKANIFQVEADIANVGHFVIHESSLDEIMIQKLPAGELNAQGIYNIPSFRIDDSTQLALLITSCLKECERDNYKSIAFPVLGSGGGYFSAQDTSRTVIDTLDEYFVNYRGTCIRTVTVVLNPAHRRTADIFESHWRELSPRKQLLNQTTEHRKIVRTIGELAYGSIRLTICLVVEALSAVDSVQIKSIMDDWESSCTSITVVDPVPVSLKYLKLLLVRLETDSREGVMISNDTIYSSLCTAEKHGVRSLVIPILPLNRLAKVNCFNSIFKELRKFQTARHRIDIVKDVTLVHHVASELTPDMIRAELFALNLVLRYSTCMHQSTSQKICIAGTSDSIWAAKSMLANGLIDEYVEIQ